MLKTFAQSFKLRNAYKANGFIYSLKSIPLIKKLLPDALYASKTLKTIANIIAVFIEIVLTFIGKAIYLLCLVLLPVILEFSKNNNIDTALHIFFFLTIAGGLLNTNLFNPSKDKFYAMFLMRMDAKEYTLTNYLYFLFKMFIGFLPFTLLFVYLIQIPLLIAFIMPIFVCAVKIIANAFYLLRYKKHEKIQNENLPEPFIWAGVAAAFILAYSLPFFGYAISSQTFMLLALATIILGCLAFRTIWTFSQYRRVYHTLLTEKNLALSSGSMKAGAQYTKESYRKKITVDLNQTSNKSGYKYLNELFVKRHSKLLTKSAKRISLIAVGVLIVTILFILIYPESKPTINNALLTYYSVSLILMYIVNRGKVVTQAFFINCDSSMLTYRFFRKPKAILSLFKERLLCLIKVNLMPALVISLVLPLTLYLSGGTDNPLNYILLTVSILAISIFFSVHTLVIYYLLQPYNANVETKNAFYFIIDMITYYICYFAAGKAFSTLIFAIAVSGFAIIYVIVALIIVYKFAPKTFKLRQ